MKEKILVPIAYFIVCFFWGISWLAIQLSLPSFPPFFNAGLRFLFTAIIIFLIAVIFKFKVSFDKESLRIYIFMGLFCFTVPFAFVYWAEQYIPSSLASILFGMYPFMVMLFSYFFISKESFGLNKIVGIVIAFCGLIVIFSEGLRINFQEYFLGMLAVFISATTQGAMAVYLKKKAEKLNPMTMNMIPAFFAAIILFTLGVSFEGISSINFKWSAFLMILFLAFFATVLTFTAYYWLLKRVNVVILSLTSFITPIVSIIFGWLLNDEKLTTNIFYGSGMILFGILFVNLKFRKKLK